MNRFLPNMSVAEYDTKFTCLAQYVPHLMTNERHMIKRFVMGL